MTSIKKASVTLGGVSLAGSSSVTWNFTTGTRPYTTTLTVPHTGWSQLKNRKGDPLTLKIVDSRSNTLEIKNVFILHTAPSTSPNRVSFVVADKRWRWQYKLIARDYNIPRKTGDKTTNFDQVPVETRQTIDQYDYLPYSLRNGTAVWTPKEAILDLLDTIERRTQQNTAGGYRIDSFPISAKAMERAGSSTDGTFTMQGVMLRDQADVALTRLLSYVPGADIYVNAEGLVVVYDAADIDAAQSYFKNLPATTWVGEQVTWVQREVIRPKKVIVHYEREVESVFSFEDDFNSTTAVTYNEDEPYLENVIPTVDPETEITVWDPVAREYVNITVPPGTWVNVHRWLEAMDNDKPADSLPWTFETARIHWLKGDLEGVWGARGLDLDASANVAMRVSAFRQHFRQTFRINRRYMQRVKSLRAVRVALLDPVTGARAPAASWGQACIIPSTKGKYMAARNGGGNYKVFRNVDYLYPSEHGGEELIYTAPGPARVNIIDAELGIFRLRWLASPYGVTDSFIPCNLVGENTTNEKSVTRDLADQDEEPVGVGMKVESGTNGIWLKKTMELKVLMTIVPAAPNNTRRFHKVEVTADDISKLFRKEFYITGGEGPDLELFVSPGEVTARFAWDNSDTAEETIKTLLGMSESDPSNAGIESNELDGFVLANANRSLSSHARSYAAEVLSSFADSIQGTVSTALPQDGIRMVGNMGGASVRVSKYPSAKVDAVFDFPGQQKPISRTALLPEAARAVILGIVQFKG